MPAAITLYIPTARDLLAMPSCPEGKDWAILDVRGGRADLRMFLPTGPLMKLEGAYWTEWLIAIQGRILTATDASPKQRDTLLELVYAFNIFTDGHRDVDSDHYTVFIAKIIEIATSDPPFEPVDAKLEEIIALARKLIPQTVWAVYVLPPPPDYPAQLFGFSSPEESDEWARAFINTWREARAHLFHSAAHAIASSERAMPFAPPRLPLRRFPSPEHPPPSTPPSSSSPPTSSLARSSSPGGSSDSDSAPPPLESCTSDSEGEQSEIHIGTSAAGVPDAHDVLDSGYASDDSVPSLLTVDGSSDSDFEDERVERARVLRTHLDRFVF